MKLREYLDENGIKVKFFAEKLGTSPTQISMWLRGARNPNRESMIKIEKATKGKVKPRDWFSD